MTLAPGSRLGGYEITGKLGEGGMGEVFRATDSKLKREVAIKVLPAAFTEDKERLARFEREAQLLAQLHHTNIASIFGLEESDGVRALVMELVEGPTLDERLKAGVLSLEECLSIARQIAEALEEAHEKGIVHRDLKPQNVKAPVDGKVKVLDFGLAKAMDPPGASSAADLARSPTIMNSPTMTAAHGTQLGVILGTAAYMSPEQARGGAVDKRADIWAFGVVLFEMLSGRPLFAAETVSDTLAGVLKTEIDFGALPAATPPALRQLLRRCLERSPKNRLHDIADARIVLDDLLAGRGDAAGSAAAAPSQPPPRRASRRELAAWGLALLATVAAAVLFVGRTRAPNVAALPAPGVTRFSFALSEKGAIEGFPALSPDGRTLVYTLQQEDGSSALWAQSFETGTEPAPAWNRRRRAAVLGARRQTARVLRRRPAQAARPRHGADPERLPRRGPARRGVGRDGDILVSLNAASPLLRISTASGESHPATKLAPERGEQSHRFPWALPGGGFLYTSTGSPKVQGIYWFGRGAKSARRILPDLSRALLDERGYLLWVREGTLVAQRFDPERGELSGGLVPVAEGVGVDPQRASATWFAASVSGTIAFRQGVEQRSELVWTDRKGTALGSLASPGDYREPSISADGRMVVVANSPRAEISQLWVYETSGTDRGRRLTFDAGGGETAVFSPDGRWVAYSSARANGFTLFRKPADGSGEEESLFEAGGGSWVDSWSPDGRHLLFERFVPERGSDLWILPLDGTRKAVPFLETPANETHAAFSPDGRLVAYVSDEGGMPQIFVRTFPASGSRWQVSRSGGDWPAWSADGKELYFVGLDRVLQAVPITGTSPFSFGGPAPLFRMRVPQPAITSNRTYFAPAPDGRRFLVNQLVGTAGGSRIEVLMNWTPQGGRP